MVFEVTYEAWWCENCEVLNEVTDQAEPLYVGETLSCRNCGSEYTFTIENESVGAGDDDV